MSYSSKDTPTNPPSLLQNFCGRSLFPNYCTGGCIVVMFWIWYQCRRRGTVAERDQDTCSDQVGTLPGLETEPLCNEPCFGALMTKATLFLCSKAGLSKQLHLWGPVLAPRTTALNLASELFAGSECPGTTGHKRQENLWKLLSWPAFM